MSTQQALSTNWRTINIDALEPDSAYNFDTASLTPGLAGISAPEVQTLGQQIRQLLRGGDAEGALRGALENVPYGGPGEAKEVHLATVVEVLQSIKQADMSPILGRIYSSSGGIELLDALVKYLYKGMSQPSAGPARILSPQSTGFSQIQSRGAAEGGGQAMSVLLSWHEKVVEVAGQGAIIRAMTDRRTV